ncbi:MAG: tetratricopeptide repeat protein [Bacteroidia bacterium]
MKVVLSVLVFTLILSFNAIAQKLNPDSLWAVWNNESQPDTARLMAMDDLTFNYYYRQKYQLDSVIYYTDLMLDLAIQKGNKKYQANALHNMALAYHQQLNSEKSLELNQQSLAIREEIGHKKGIGRSLANIGGIHRARGDNATALIHYKRALKYFEEINDFGLISHALTYMGLLYSEMDDLPKAINCAAKSMRVAEKANNDYFLSQSLQSLSSLYYKALDYKKALDYAEKARDLSLENNDRNNYLQSLYFISQSLLNDGKLEAALAQCKETLSIVKTTDNPIHSVYSLGLMGSIYEKMNDLDKAFETYTKSQEILKASKIKTNKLANTLSLGYVNRLKGNWAEAIKWCLEAYHEAEIQNNLSSQVGACNCLYKSYKGKSDGNNALIYHEKLLALTDSLQVEDASKKLQQMEFQKRLLEDSLEQVEKDRTLEASHAEEMRKEEKTRNILIVSSFFVLLLAGSIYIRLRYVRKSKAIIEKEKDRSENLLLNILPAEIAQELKEKGKADARDFEMVSILFTDFKQFTQASEKLSAAELVNEINECFKAFDAIIEKYSIEKIKTIGDSYMAAGGLPVPDDYSTINTVLAAIEMQEFIKKRKATKEANGEPAFEMRAGVHTGPVVAGIVGVKKFQYDIWGDTVNTASRMESHGEVGKVNISEATYELLKDDDAFAFEAREELEIKGKGLMKTYFVSSKA